MKLIAISLLAINISGAAYFPELSGRIMLNPPHNAVGIPKHTVKTIQQQIPGTIDGKDDPGMIPDHVAYEIVLRSFSSKQDRDIFTPDNHRITKEYNAPRN